MHYNIMKMDFYWALEMSLDYNAPDGEQQYEYIREKLDKIYEAQDSFQQQANVIYDHLSNINFERFIQQSAWAVEDEARFNQDLERAQEQYGDYEMELSEIEFYLSEQSEV